MTAIPRTSQPKRRAAGTDRWLPALEQFNAQGLAPFLSRYAGMDALAGRDVVLHGEGGTRAGQAIGIAADGALRVRSDGIEHHVHSGEISVRTT